MGWSRAISDEIHSSVCCAQLPLDARSPFSMNPPRPIFPSLKDPGCDDTALVDGDMFERLLQPGLPIMHTNPSYRLSNRMATVHLPSACRALEQPASACVRRRMATGQATGGNRSKPNALHVNKEKICIPNKY